MKISTKKIVINGLMIALVFLATYFTHIPSPLPGGYFNLGDTAIFAAAVVLGRNSGLLAGALGSFLADMAFGSFLFAPVTFVVKGFEGYVAGAIASCRGCKYPAELCRAMAVAAGASVMAAGYFLAEATVLQLFDKTFGLAAAFLELPTNLAQGGLSAIVGYVLSTLLLRVNVKKLLD